MAQIHVDKVTDSPSAAEQTSGSAAQRTYPEGVDEQIDADGAEVALREFGLAIDELHDAAKDGAVVRATARPFLHLWHLWGLFPAHFFAKLAETKYKIGWSCIVSGNSRWIRSADRRIGVVLWPGNQKTGSRSERAKNVRAKGQEMRMLLECVGEVPPDVLPGTEAAMNEVVGEDGEEFFALIPPSERPREFLAILYNRRGTFVNLEAQVLHQKEPLTKDGYIRGTRLRILMPSVEVVGVPQLKLIDAPPMNGGPDAVPFSMEPIEDEETDE